MHYVKDLFEGTASEHAHNKFTRYSKGDFQGPLLKLRVSKTEVKISASFHFVDELLTLVAKALGPQANVHINGSLVWNQDLTQEFAKLGIMYSKVSKSRGIFKYQLDNEVNIKDFVDTMNNFNLLVQIKTEQGVSLTTKNSFPKPNKEFSNTFCKAVFPAKMLDYIVKEFAFDIKEPKLKGFDVKHRIIIDDIDLPDNVEDFDAARRLAKRIGSIERTLVVNGGEEVKSSCKINI